ncbi:ATP-binding protein [Sporichthya sp.]|uniref:ATP-binding protein n=1 Tax=Sporichthya sp. TaxID=65475 RepID=UPI0025E84F0E|nr:ATP-binding protein [Sporichthya sp.]
MVLLTGPRQAGKSTLARAVADVPPSNVFDLEDPRDLARLGEPTLSLPGLAGTVIIDEAQRRQDLFPILRVLADADDRPGRFLVLGSASPDLVGLASESLAGRVALVEIAGFRVSDVGTARTDDLWMRGGLPRSYLADGEENSAAWRDDYISTFLERDLGNLGVRIPATTMRRFWTMLAHFHAQTWNGAELARAIGVSEPTVRRYLDALTDALVVRQLQPWFANISKRQVRSPKVYVRDSGLLHRLLGIADAGALWGHPKVGASWEGFVLEQLLAMEVRDPWFWSTHGGAELDLLVEVGGARVGVEIKRTDQPRLTPSIRHARVDLNLDRLVVVHAGESRFVLGDGVEAIGARLLFELGPAVLAGSA